MSKQKLFPRICVYRLFASGSLLSSCAWGAASQLISAARNGTQPAHDISMENLDTIGRALACLLMPICFGAVLVAQNHDVATSPTGAAMHVTHVLGFEGVSNNACGNLSIQGNALRFQKNQGAGAQINIGAIQDVFVGEEDKQVGGTAMAVSQVAAPFGGGRVVGLFSHKKYDTLTLEYLDLNGGVHGAIFQLNKGQGQVLKNELLAEGAHVNNLENQMAKQSTQENKDETK
jgi:hypothetical protein